MCKIARTSMLLIAGMCLLWALPSFAQSLGDVARAQRQQEKTKSTQAKPKIITNEDLPDHPDSDGAAPSTAASNANSAEPPAASNKSSASKEERGQHWKQAIQQQKEAVAGMQRQLDDLNASIRYVEANRYSNGVEYHQHQARKQEEAQRMQKQLDEQKSKLLNMQESARQEGFGSAIYDP